MIKVVIMIELDDDETSIVCAPPPNRAYRDRGAELASTALERAMGDARTWLDVRREVRSR